VTREKGDVSKIKNPFQPNQQEKYCGNCFNHAPFEYPLKVFCELNFRSGNSVPESVRHSLDTCERWKTMSKSGTCCCVKDSKEHLQLNGILSTKKDALVARAESEPSSEEPYYPDEGYDQVFSHREPKPIEDTY